MPPAEHLDAAGRVRTSRRKRIWDAARSLQTASVTTQKKETTTTNDTTPNLIIIAMYIKMAGPISYLAKARILTIAIKLMRCEDCESEFGRK